MLELKARKANANILWLMDPFSTVFLSPYRLYFKDASVVTEITGLTFFFFSYITKKT